MVRHVVCLFYVCREELNYKLSLSLKYSCITFIVLNLRLHVLQKSGTSSIYTCSLSWGRGGGKFMRYNVMDTCLAKNGLCLGKNRIDRTTWQVPGEKLFWTLISGVHSFLSFTELFIQLIDKHCNWITLINSIAKWPKTTKSIY